MAQQSTKNGLPTIMPSALDLAREAAQLEKQENLTASDYHNVGEESVSSKKMEIKPTTSKITIDVSDIAINKETRVTRTFTLSVATESRLNEAALRLNCNKSSILEKAFNTWYDAVERSLNK